MQQSRRHAIHSAIERYLRCKSAHEEALADTSDSQTDEVLAKIAEAEGELEAAFEALTSMRPADIHEAFAKAQVFLAEILSEAELTQYHETALSSIIDDLAKLLGPRD